MSEHISLAEVMVSDRAKRLGIDNTPPPLIMPRLKMGAGQMERVRDRLGGHPIIFTSVYRCPALNAATPGSAKKSAHTEGWAWDFTCPGFGSPLQVAERIARSSLTFDQLIHECPGASWVHISFDPRRRGQLLTIDAAGTREGLLAARP